MYNICILQFAVANSAIAGDGKSTIAARGGVRKGKEGVKDPYLKPRIELRNKIVGRG